MSERPDMRGECTIMPSRTSLLIGLVCTGTFSLLILSEGLARWIGAFVAILFVYLLIQVFRGAPIIRATHDGLYLGIGTFGRSFYVPWERVDAVVLTEAVTNGPENSRTTAALGFVIQQTDTFRLPSMLWNSSGRDDGPPHSNVKFSSDMIDGDVKRWVEKLEAIRKSARRLNS